MSHSIVARTAALTLVVSVLVPSGRIAQAQNMIVTGVCSSRTGPINGCAVHINEVGTTVTTGPDGVFTLVVNLANRKETSLNVRARALGYVLQTHAVPVKAGSQTVNFAMQSGPDQPDRVSLSTSPVPGADPFVVFMFPPELVMMHQDAIGLKEDQRTALQVAVQQTQEQVIKMQWRLALASEKLTKTLSTPALDEKEVLSVLDFILAAEREIKRAQISLLVRIKNTLTPEQQDKLRQLRAQTRE